MARLSSPTPQKPFKRYVVEFLVIFISVVFAFFIENLRESMNEKSQYKEAMILFAYDLAGEVEDMQNQVDSFRVVGNQGTGSYYEDLLEYIWIDSLLDQNAATMHHLKYMIQHNYLLNIYLPLIMASPLPDVIRSKYGEYANRRIVRRLLPNYERAMEALLVIEQEQDQVIRNMNDILSQLDADYNFDEHDSLLFYSNEFRWNLKLLIRTKKHDYYTRKFYAYDKFIVILDALADEATLFDFLIPEDKYCYRMDDFIERYTCNYGEAPKEVVSIETLIQNRREKYFFEQKNQ